ncbi:pancreatic lipase-related protein 2-like isoform X2 [Leptopilina boulardi]|nr:pancreatic lipase-related protein 2-like isoform X2 [Leptopilina boulardi]XP_051170179.1 pancreatic lipase-related protein 2-like isoform X2 [Leptopilina boulardi]
MNYPWFTLLRPFPSPMSPERVGTTVYFANRKNREKIKIQTWPHIKVASYYKAKRPTVILTHGLSSDANTEWMKNLTDSFLYKNDYNIFLINWEEGASYLYCQAASNTRIVAAEIVRLIRHLESHYFIDLSKFHLMGHSLGAHIMSYVGKQIKGIGRLTALDPAQPGFQGKNALVRLDNADAKFVDVIHTDGKPFCPFLGLGMEVSVGSVDFFVNGGLAQPGCIFDGKIYNITSIKDIVNITMDVIYNLATCSHSRAARYMAVAIRDECKMWGYRYNATYSNHRYENFILKESCTPDHCNLMGLDTHKYRARGNFAVKTTGNYPFCVQDDKATKLMDKPKWSPWDIIWGK